MRLANLRTRGFKRLKDFEVDLEHDRVLVVGPNEAGKSTLIEALLTGLYGLAPAKRGSGHAGGLKHVLPWTGEPAGLALSYELDDGRRIEVDWDLSGERTQVINHSSGEDISATFATGTHGWLDVGDSLLHLPGSVFAQVACVGEGQLALITDDVEVRQSLLRVTDSGVDVLVEHALRRLEEAARQASIPKVNAATRRNELARQLTAAATQLASARLAREALEAEVEVIRETERKLEQAGALLAHILVEEERRNTERSRLSTEVERARGRLAEAEARLALLEPDRRAPGPDRPGWSDDELEQGRAKLVAGPDRRSLARLPGLPALAAIGAGVVGLVAGIALHLVPLGLFGAVIVAVGVFLATKDGRPVYEDLRVGEAKFGSRQELMSAMEHERARRDQQEHLAAVQRLQLDIEDLLQRPSLTGVGAPGEIDASALTALSIHELGHQSTQALENQQQLKIELARQRASLERGARLIPEISPLEERVLEVQEQVDHLEAFGVASRLAAVNLAEASEEIRRAYAPKLQAYLGRDLARITGGRYTEALVNEKFEILLRAPETKSMVDLRRLSRGTQQQIYLLLRLGLLEIMGGGTETLPLFLDDALALADDARRAELLKVLESEQRQVIYFTAGESGAAAAFGSQWHRLTLPRPVGGEVEDIPAAGAPPLRVVDNPLD